MDQPVAALDLARIFVGEQSALYFLEVAFRTVIIYGYAFVLIRWIGGRSIAQLSTVELLLVIALGSAVGDPMFYPDVPLLYCLVVVTVVVLLNKGLDLLIFHSERTEKMIEGEPVEVVRDGRVRWETLASRKLGHGELFQQLRNKGISSLGQVRCAYLEANGTVSVFRHEPPKAGLPIVPPWAVRAPAVFQAGETAPSLPALACQRCGETVGCRGIDAIPACPACGHSDWVEATDGSKLPAA